MVFDTLLPTYDFRGNVSACLIANLSTNSETFSVFGSCRVNDEDPETWFENVSSWGLGALSDPRPHRAAPAGGGGAYGLGLG